MSQVKTERLVNLTMALLNSRRYMKKSEIFQKVSGYSGTEETKERMFERDKDDLRSLGIEIEVASHDPLFEDEPGYRIRPDAYQLPLTDLTQKESSIIAAALGLWRASGLEQDAITAARRVYSNAEIASEIFDKQISPVEFTEDRLISVSRALAAKSTITFDYRKNDHERGEQRKVNPFGLSAWQGNWYLVGEDLNRDDIRVFRLSRISSEIEVSRKRESYEIPNDFDVKDYLIMLEKNEVNVRFKILKDQGTGIRQIASSINSVDDDSDLIEARYSNEQDAIRDALWYADCAELIAPEQLRIEVKANLERIIRNHE